MTPLLYSCGVGLLLSTRGQSQIVIHYQWTNNNTISGWNHRSVVAKLECRTWLCVMFKRIHIWGIIISFTVFNVQFTLGDSFHTFYSLFSSAKNNTNKLLLLYNAVTVLLFSPLTIMCSSFFIPVQIFLFLFYLIVFFFLLITKTYCGGIAIVYISY